MRSTQSLRAVLVVLVLALVSSALAQTAGRTPFGKLVVEGKAFEGDLRGPWEWSKGVIVTAEAMTMTCDTLKAWPAKGGQDFERIEAEGNVRLNGAYTATDKSKWTVKGSAQSAAFDSKAGTAVLRGGVDFRAVSIVSGGVLNVQAEKLVYDQKTGKFRFEPQSGQQVRVEFEEPKPAAAPEVKK
jgi:lipopolysaccharide export system protein LptA